MTFFVGAEETVYARCYRLHGRRVYPLDHPVVDSLLYDHLRDALGAIHTRTDSDRLCAYDQALGKSRPNWRICRSDLDAWLKRRAGGPPPVATPLTRAGAASRHFK